MLKINFKRVFIIFLFVLCISNSVFATQEEILHSQSETLKIKDFVSEANKYTGEVFSNIDVNELMNGAIKGDINSKTLIGNILNIFGKEIGQTFRVVRKYSYCYCSSYHIKKYK